MIAKDDTIPDVVAAHPATRRVFDAYGLHGCGGALGPPETLEFFARVHGVALDRLLAELETAKTDPPATGDAYREELADRLYRRFFRAAIGVLLAGGAGLGVLLGVLLARRGTLASADVAPLVQAHGHAQVFGWLGLFVMGFAVQGIPRFKYARLWRPRLANLAFVLTLAGVALRLAGAVPARGAPALGVVGAFAVGVGVSLFSLVLARTMRSSPTREPWDKWVAGSVVCLLLAAWLEAALALALLLAATPEAAARLVAAFAGGLRDLELLGFGGMMVLGVGQRILPTAFGFRAVERGACNSGFALATGGLTLALAGGALVHVTGADAWESVAWAGHALYALGAFTILFAARGLFGGTPDRSRKFLRAATAWCLLAVAMRVAEPLVLRTLGADASVGWLGASRHAFAVGFLSMAILGVSAKVVPILRGLDPATQTALLVPFLLVNAGNALRVGAEFATGFAPKPAFPALVAGAAITAFGFFLWAIHLLRLLRHRAPAPIAERGGSGSGIDAEMSPASVVERWPEAIEVFAAFGFGELRNPLLRGTVGRRITLRTACSMKGVRLEDLLRALRERVAAGRA